MESCEMSPCVPEFSVQSDDGRWYVQALPKFIRSKKDDEWMFLVTCQCGFPDAQWHAGTGYVIKAVELPADGSGYLEPGESRASIPSHWPSSNELKVYRFSETFWE